MLSQKRSSLGTMTKSFIVFSRIVSLVHKIECKKKYFCYGNNDFLQFTNDFHSSLCHSWKLLANLLLMTWKLLFKVTHALLYIYFNQYYKMIQSISWLYLTASSIFIHSPVLCNHVLPLAAPEVTMDDHNDQRSINKLNQYLHKSLHTSILEQQYHI